MPDPAELRDAMPFAGTVGIELSEASAERVSGRLAWAPELTTAGGVLHGGAVMALADAARRGLRLPQPARGAQTSTIESKTNFFRAVREGHVEATSTPLHVGRSTIVVQTDVRDADGRRVALTVQTQSVLAPPS